MNSAFDHLRVGIYRGRFAPIHNGHVASAKAFMEQMKLDYLFVIPAFIGDGSEDDSPLMRLRMCELAFEGVDGIIISDTEIRGEGRIGLCDILRELSRPDTRLFLHMGTDEVLSFGDRADVSEILSLCYPTYSRRERDVFLEKRIVEKISLYYKTYGVMFRRIVTEPQEISSTVIRRSVAEGLNISGLVPEVVARFIREHGLYRGKEGIAK